MFRTNNNNGEFFPTSLSVSLSASLFLSVYLSVCLFVYLSVGLSVCLYLSYFSLTLFFSLSLFHSVTPTALHLFIITLIFYLSLLFAILFTSLHFLSLSPSLSLTISLTLFYPSKSLQSDILSLPYPIIIFLSLKVKQCYLFIARYNKSYYMYKERSITVYTEESMALSSSCSVYHHGKTSEDKVPQPQGEATLAPALRR